VHVIIALLPLLLALIAGKPARSFWRELGSGVAMVGFAMLLLAFMLSGRYRGVSGRVGLALHHTLAVGSHSADRLLTAFWTILAALALLPCCMRAWSSR
jgi:hypothetical protein